MRYPKITERLGIDVREVERSIVLALAELSAALVDG